MGRNRAPTAVLESRGLSTEIQTADVSSSRVYQLRYPIHHRRTLPKPVRLAWLEMRERGYWLTSADRFLVQIAATLMARYRFEEMKSGDVSQLIQLLGKLDEGSQRIEFANQVKKGRFRAGNVSAVGGLFGFGLDVPGGAKLGPCPMGTIGRSRNTVRINAFIDGGLSQRSTQVRRRVAFDRATRQHRLLAQRTRQPVPQHNRK